MDVIWLGAVPGAVSSPVVAADFTRMDVTTDPGTSRRWRDMGWTVEGPFYHQSDMPPTCVACPECGSEVDTREAERL